MRRLAAQKRTVEQWRSLEKSTVDIAEMIKHGGGRSGQLFTDEIRTDIENLATLLDKLELELHQRRVRFTECHFGRYMPEREGQNPRIGRRCCSECISDGGTARLQSRNTG